MQAWQHTALKLLLGKFFFAVYAGLGLLYFILSQVFLQEEKIGSALIATISLMTGGDPYYFKTTIEPYPGLWTLAWLIHVTSWVLIPVLISIVVSDATNKIMSRQVFWETLAQFFSDSIPKDIAMQRARELAEKIEEAVKHMTSTGRNQ